MRGEFRGGEVDVEADELLTLLLTVTGFQNSYLKIDFIKLFSIAKLMPILSRPQKQRDPNMNWK